MAENPPEAAPHLPPTWAEYGHTVADEDFIVGSRAGLSSLRDHIEEAILHGESRIEDPRIGFNGIKCKEVPPYASTKSWRASFFNYGCSALALVILALAVYGAVSLSSIIRAAR